MKELIQQGDLSMRLEEIIEEREQGFLNREALLEEEKKELQEVREQLERQKEEQEISSQKLEEKKERLEKRESELWKKEEFLKKEEVRIATEKNELQEKFDSMQQDITKMHEQLVIKNQVALQELKSKEEQLQFEREKLEKDTGMLRLGLLNPEKYIKKEMYDQAVAELNDVIHDMEDQSKIRSRELEIKIEELEVQSQKLEEEKQALMDQILTMSQEKEIFEEESVEEPINEEILSAGEDENFFCEELTVSVIEQALLHSSEGFSDIERRHSDLGEQIAAKRGKLQYRFVFDMPCYFDVFQSRRYSRSLEKKLMKLNELKPEFKFSYDKKNKMVIATGYFTEDMDITVLMDSVLEASNCFKE